MKYREKFSHYTDGRPYFFHQTVVAEGHRELLYAHWHPEMEILWICSGAMEFYLEKGDYMILPPSRIHYGLSDHGRACSFCAFVFTPTWLFNTQNWPCQEKYLLPFLYHGQESTLCLRADSIRNQSIFDELQQIFICGTMPVRTTASPAPSTTSTKTIRRTLHWSSSPTGAASAANITAAVSSDSPDFLLLTI